MKKNLTTCASDLKTEELTEIDVAMETERISSPRLISLVCCKHKLLV